MTNQPPHQYRLPQHLLRAREAVMAYFRPMLNNYGLTEQQWRIMRLLYERGEIEAGLIAEMACILSPSLTGILVRMQKAGLIYRNRDKMDNRRLIVSLTPEGRELTQEISPLSTRCYEQITAHFGENKIALLLSLLTELEQLPAPPEAAYASPLQEDVE